MTWSSSYRVQEALSQRPRGNYQKFQRVINKKTKQLDPAARGYPSVKIDEYLVLITNRRRGWQISEQLQPLLRMENCDYAHVVRRVIAQPLLTPWRAVPSGMRLEAAPKAARLGVGRTSGTYTIIDRKDGEMDF